jgi:hypothetical protein
MGHSRPKITEQHIAQINELLIENPGWNRTRLSKELCIKWDWQSSVGQIKDLSCRDLLRDLEKTGKIILPPPQRGTRQIGSGADKIRFIEHSTEPIETNLHNLTPLKVEIIDNKEGIVEFKSYIAQYHYLGYDRSIGENMKYIIKSKSGISLACMMFGSASWKCKPRDEFIGWNNDERESGLLFLTNNVRNLIFPWVRVPYLASHTLSLISRRLSNDWQAKYGHPIYLLETFVEKLRFRGVSYLAANWIHVGETTGRGRNSKSTRPALPIKDIWLYPLRGDFKSKIIGRSI